MLVEDLLKRFELFQDLDEVGLRKVLQFGRFKYFPKGSMIYGQGELGAGLLCVLEGSIELFHEKSGADSEEAGSDHQMDSSSRDIVDCIGAGEFLGESTLFGEVKKRASSARAAEDTFLLWINTLEYRRLQNSGPMELTKILLRLVIGLSSTFRAKNQEFGELKKKLKELEVFRNA